MAALATRAETSATEPHRGLCTECFRPVLVALVKRTVVVAEVHEWEPRAACFVCATIRARGQHRERCDRCGGSGYVGAARPPGRMLAIDVAWSDESHVRLIGPRTTRKRGEALYEIHSCASPLVRAA
jgi:hypothetical protein